MDRYGKCPKTGKLFKVSGPTPEPKTDEEPKLFQCPFCQKQHPLMWPKGNSFVVSAAQQP